MAVRKLPLRRRLEEWAARLVWQAGRRRLEPVRETRAYARLMNLGGWQLSSKRPLIKPTPANLRRFAKSPYARAAIKRIKEPIANLGWQIVPMVDADGNRPEWTGELKRQAAIATACLKKPNHEDDWRSFAGQLLEDSLVGGASAYEHELGADPVRPFWAWPVDVLSIQINAVWSGKPSEPRYFQTLGYGNLGGVEGVALRNDELAYIRTDPSTESPFGLGPLEVAFTTISRKLGVEDFAGKVTSAAQPENLIVLPGFGQGELDTLRDWWRNDVEGQGQTPFVGGNTDETWKPQVFKLRGTDDKALFLAYQELLIREIAAAFRISPLSLGVQQDVNRNTAEVVDDMDWDNAIVPAATLLSAGITRHSLHERLGFTQLELQFLGLKRDDKKAEAEIYEKEFKNNAIVPDEYRARNNMPPLESQWGKMTFADMQIAIAAARGVGVVDDSDLSGQQTQKGVKSGQKKP